MTSADVHGKFLWHELLTTDPASAGAFYTKVLGWRAQAWDKDPSYTVLTGGKGPVGGVMRLPAESAGNAGSPHWLAYIGVRDIDATAAAVQRLGGRVIKAPAQIPDGGRYAVLADPQSGTFGIYTPAATGSSSSESAEFTWHELATADHSAAFRFYRELFGWEQLAIHDMGATGPYLIFGRHGERLGGMFNRPSSLPSSWPHWLVYASVPSAARAAEAAATAGGRIVNGPTQVPDGTWIAQLVDPQGAAIAVNQTASAGASRPAAAAPRPAAAPAPKPPAAPAPKPTPPPRPAQAGDGAPPAAPRPAAAPSVRPAEHGAPRPAPKPVEAPRPAPAPAAPKPAPPPAAAPAAAPKAPAKPASRPAPAAKKVKRVKTAKKAKSAKKKARAAGRRRKKKVAAARKRPATRRAASRARRKGSARKGKKAARRKKSGRRGRR